VKQRLGDKIAASLCGLILFVISVFVFLRCIGFAPVWLHNSALLFSVAETGMGTRIITLVVSIFTMLLGAYCFLLIVKRARAGKRFVVQKTDNGLMSISIKAMENLVQRCIEPHGELNIIGSRIDTSRDGVTVSLRVGLANGVSIPLAVNALQKQIKQYIQACSGIDVKEVCVQVDTANAKVVDSPFMVRDVLVKEEDHEYHGEYVSKQDTQDNPELAVEPIMKHDENAYEETAVSDVKAEVEIVADESVRKPLHQRLFGRETQPEPPQSAPAAEQTQEETASEAASDDSGTETGEQ